MRRFLLLLGNVLLSQDPSVQVPSALEGLTVVFGMGTRGSPLPSSPNFFRSIASMCIQQEKSVHLKDPIACLNKK